HLDLARSAGLTFLPRRGREFVRLAFWNAALVCLRRNLLPESARRPKQLRRLDLRKRMASVPVILSDQWPGRKPRGWAESLETLATMSYWRKSDAGARA